MCADKARGSISTHTLRKEGDFEKGKNVGGLHTISTHTLRKEGDARNNPSAFQDIIASYISTHTLRKEGDGTIYSTASWAKLFQPTPSARRVTNVIYLVPASSGISTHTLRKEGDLTAAGGLSGARHFNPHPPQGG